MLLYITSNLAALGLGGGASTVRAARVPMRRTERKEEETDEEGGKYRVESPSYVLRVCPLALSTAVCVVVVEVMFLSG